MTGPPSQPISSNHAGLFVFILGLPCSVTIFRLKEIAGKDRFWPHAAFLATLAYLAIIAQRDFGFETWAVSRQLPFNLHQPAMPTVGRA